MTRLVFFPHGWKPQGRGWLFFPTASIRSTQKAQFVFARKFVEFSEQEALTGFQRKFSFGGFYVFGCAWLVSHDDQSL